MRPPWGLFSNLGPAYASEVCPVVVRGYLTTYVNLSWTIGQPKPAGVLSVCFAPESPWWLIRFARMDVAGNQLDCLKGTDLRRTEICCVAYSVQTWCGFAISGYSTYFFEQAGLSASSAYKLGVVQGAIAIVGTVLAWTVMNSVGCRRRTSR